MKSNSKIPRKKKQPSKTTVKLKAWYAFSQFIRLRDCLRTTGKPDYGKCITCGETFPFNLLQAGHFIPGRHSSNLFSEKGVHAQCRACNIWHHGRPLEYRRAVINLYGKGFDEKLEQEAREIKKYTIEDYYQIAETYKGKYQKLLDKSI